MAEQRCPTHDVPRTISAAAQATLLRARQKRRETRTIARVLSCGLLAASLLLWRSLGPFATPIVAAALASAVAPLVTPHRLRGPTANQKLPTLARTWLLIFSVAFAGQEAAQIAQQQVALVRQRTCNQVAVAALYRRPARPGTTLTVACEQGAVSLR